MPLDFSCGGYGVCGKCKVRVMGGELTPATPEETGLLSPSELSDGYRLACQARPLGDVTLHVPAPSMPVVEAAATSGAVPRAFEVAPAVRSCYIELSPPTMDDPAADSDRLKEGLMARYGLPGLSVSYHILRDVPSALREAGWKVTALVRGREIIGLKGGYRPGVVGAAFDVGTTNIEGWLLDLGGGQELARASAANPQAVFGADVMSRISYALMGEEAALKLQGLLVDALNGMLKEMAGSVGLSGGAREVSEVALVGNTAMHHLLLGLPVGQLGVYPFTPALTRGMEFPAREIGLAVSESGYAVTLPVIGGFVGADHAAALLSEGPYNQDAVTLIIDAGTNGEIALGNRRRLLTASCATGPAFEGASVRFGMRALPGAIYRVMIDPDTGEAAYKVVGRGGWSQPLIYTGARGICGSGMVDAVAQMYGAGIIGKNGAFTGGLPGTRVRPDGPSGPEYVLAWAGETALGRDITVSACDVRAVLLAKAALWAGTRTLMAIYGVERVDRVGLAGAFGSFLDVKNAAALGMLPPCRPEDVRLIGNAAGDGAKAALLSVHKRAEAAHAAARAEYVELSLEPGFNEAFMAAIDLP